MVFRSYTNAVARASRRAAAGIFVTGLLLIGFGFLVYVLRDLFAIVATVVFFAAGIGCAITAVKILWAQRSFRKMGGSDTEGYRKNVQIHMDEHYDL